jgi:hypothetical protein
MVRLLAYWVEHLPNVTYPRQAVGIIYVSQAAENAGENPKEFTCGHSIYVINQCFPISYDVTCGEQAAEIVA